MTHMQAISLKVQAISLKLDRIIALLEANMPTPEENKIRAEIAREEMMALSLSPLGTWNGEGLS